MADSHDFRSPNEIRLSEKLNLIRLTDDGVPLSDLSNQFAISKAIVVQILKNRDQCEQIEVSPQNWNSVTLETKIKVIHLIIKKKNPSEVGRIWKIDRKIAKNNIKNNEKWIKLENSGDEMEVRCAMYAKYKSIDDDVLKLVNFLRS